MIREVVHAGVLMVEFLTHTTMVVAGTDSISPWSIGACAISLIAASAVAVRAVRGILSLETPAEIE